MEATFTRSEAARIGAMARRIDALYAHATDADRASGLAWYDRAMDAAHAISRDTGIPSDACAGIIAALSPRCQWATNVAWAHRVAHAAANGLPCPEVHTRAMRAVAWRIATGTRPLDALNGPKVRRFYANITGDHASVTVDVWAARAAEGKRDHRAPSGKRYRTIERAYQIAARKRNVSPRTMQAAVWVYVRGSAD